MEEVVLPLVKLRAAPSPRVASNTKWPHAQGQTWRWRVGESLDKIHVVPSTRVDVVAMDEALERFAQMDPQEAKVVLPRS